MCVCMCSVCVCGSVCVASTVKTHYPPPFQSHPSRYCYCGTATVDTNIHHRCVRVRTSPTTAPYLPLLLLLSAVVSKQSKQPRHKHPNNNPFHKRYPTTTKTTTTTCYYYFYDCLLPSSSFLLISKKSSTIHQARFKPSIIQQQQT